MKSVTSSSEEVTQWVKDQVRLGALAPGQRLVESDIMQLTSASRGRVRDAFKQLAAEGFVQIEEFKGASIKKPSRTEVIEMYQVRGVLEGLAARLAAATPLSSTQKKQLQQLQKQMNDAERDQEFVTFKQLNDDYHRYLQALANSAHLANHLERLRLPMLQFQVQTFFNKKRIAVSNADHRLITEAILANDPAAAERQMRKHVGGALHTIERTEDHIF